MISDFNFWNYLSKDSTKYEKTVTDKKKENFETCEINDEHTDRSFNKEKAKEWGNYFLEIGKKVTDKAAKQVSYTAKQIRQNVADIGIIEESNIITKFALEQTKFVDEKRLLEMKMKEICLPWMDVLNQNDSEQEVLKTKVLSISSDERNFMRNPPPGGDFEFNYALHSPVAQILLSEDINLATMRFKLVPKKISEEIFWRNYFYRVFLIKQSLIVNKDVTESIVVDGNETRGHLISDSTNSNDTKDNVTRYEKVRAQEPVAITSGLDNDDWEAELQKELSEFEMINDDKDREVLCDSGDYDDIEREILDELEK